MINTVHEMTLRVILNDHEIEFETLLQNNNDVSNHHRNIQTLLIETFKIKKGLLLRSWDLSLKEEIIKQR